MTKASTCLTILVLTISQCLFAAPSKLDINCLPPQDSMHGGFSVLAIQTAEKTYKLKITQSSAWYPATDRFEGTVYLTSQTENGSCVLRLVDSLDSPKTTIEMQDNASDAVTLLNGSPLFPEYKINQLNCQVSKRFLADVPQCH